MCFIAALARLRLARPHPRARADLRRGKQEFDLRERDKHCRDRLAGRSQAFELREPPAHLLAAKPEAAGLDIDQRATSRAVIPEEDRYRNDDASVD